MKCGIFSCWSFRFMDDLDQGTKRAANVYLAGPKKKKRKIKKKTKPTPIVQKISSRQESKKIIDDYHSLVHQLDQLERKKLDTENKDEIEGDSLHPIFLIFLELDKTIEAIKLSMEQMGGIRKYQDASVFDYSFRKYRPDKWVLEKLTEYNIKPEPPGKVCESHLHCLLILQLKLLDVGSLSNFFRECNWVDEMAIDISPRDSTVIQMDFFDMDPIKYANHFDVLVLSLVC